MLVSASKQQFPRQRCCSASQCLQLPSGHWHPYAPVLTCFYMKCVYLLFGGGLVTVSHSKGPFEFGGLLLYVALGSLITTLSLQDCPCIIVFISG